MYQFLVSRDINFVSGIHGELDGMYFGQERILE